MDTLQIKKDIELLNICVLLPTYNNAATLKRVIDGILQYTPHLIIVNDGATDKTSTILTAYKKVEQIHLPKNKGKGNALRIGFQKAISLGYDYAITIDSDGQHFPSDIPVFVNELKKETQKSVLLIGSRNMGQDSVPKKSSFGNKFSNFWFWIETGIKLQDTQSGFRLYPLNEYKKLTVFTTKFEFEIEVIVKSAWNGVLVKNVPVNVLYDESERVSHFRPFKDFTRISILNTWLVIVTLFYIKPRDLIRRIKKKGIKRFLLENLLGHKDSPEKKALSVALGLLIGLSPFWGFHTVIVIFLAIFLKLNKTIAFAFSNISLPPFIPFVLFLGLKMGEFILGESYSYTLDDMKENFEITEHIKTYIIGSFSLALCIAIIIGCLSYFVFLISSKKTNTNE